MKLIMPARLKCADCGIKHTSGKRCEVCGSLRIVVKRLKPKISSTSPAESLPPTTRQFRAYQRPWDYFNAQLFGGALKPCLLVFREGRRTKRGVSTGHFAPNRWRNHISESVHEISINPETLDRDLIVMVNTLVHEMCHQWQQDHGTPSRICYHDRQWADKMLEVGLTPSDTGKPGGNRPARPCRIIRPLAAASSGLSRQCPKRLPSPGLRPRQGTAGMKRARMKLRKRRREETR